MIRLLIALLALLTDGALSAQELPHDSPGFDCAAAKSAIDRLICGDVALAGLDRQMGEAFRQKLKSTDDRDALLHEQRTWLKARAPSCGIPQRDELFQAQSVEAYRSCVGELYKLRITVLAAPSSVTPAPVVQSLAAPLSPASDLPPDLKALQAGKFLRPATQADLDAWLAGTASKTDRFGRVLKPTINFPIERTMVVLGAGDLGTSLANSAGYGLIVPAGVPRPYGTRGPGPLYLMDGFVCRGQGCPTTVPPSTWTGWSHDVPSRATIEQSLHQCTLPLPDDAVVYAVSGYRGTLPTTRVMDGHDPGRVDIAVTETKRPVALLLAGNYAVQWRIGVLPGAKIAGVFVTGSDVGSVIGLPNSIPVVTTSANDRQANACSASGLRFSPNDPIFYDAPLDSLSLMVFGRNVHDAFMAPDLDHVTLGPGAFPPVESMNFSNDRGDPFAVDQDVVLNGMTGVAQLTEKGLVRHATDNELLLWVEGYEKTVGHHVLLSGKGIAWMLTGAKRLPSHPGGWDNIFILPAGAEMPVDSGHTWAILKMDDFSCVGGDCMALLHSSGRAIIFKAGEKPVVVPPPK